MKILYEIAHLILFAAIILLLTITLARYALIENPEQKIYSWSVGDPIEPEYWLDKNYTAKGDNDAD